MLLSAENSSVAMATYKEGMGFQIMNNSLCSGTTSSQKYFILIQAILFLSLLSSNCQHVILEKWFLFQGERAHSLYFLYVLKVKK